MRTRMPLGLAAAGVGCSRFSPSPVIVKARNGHVTLRGHDTRGKHVYIVQFDPAESSQYDPATTKRRFTVTR